MAHFVHPYLQLILERMAKDPELCWHLLLSGAAGYKGPPFQYSPLSGESYIRVIKILPGTRHDLLRCEMLEIDLDLKTPEPYKALSYAWGPRDHEICLPLQNGLSIKITPNLYSALLRIRSEEEYITLWVDAICINQNTDVDSLQERAGQVRMMDRIFSAAQMVIVDLGGANPALAAPLIDGLDQFCVKPLTAFRDAMVNHKPVEDFIKYNGDHPFWQSFEDLMGRPWFQRVWVVQEYILAKEVRFILGTSYFERQYLINAAPKVKLHFSAMFDSGLYRYPKSHYQNGPIVDWAGGYHNFIIWDALKEGYHTRGEKPSIEVALNATSLLKATDQRDYIYALMGLVPELKTSGFKVSYTESKMELSIRLGEFLFSQGRGLFCLSRAVGINAENQPTWSPTLKQQYVASGLQLTVSSSLSKMFQACGGTTYKAYINNDDLSYKKLSIEAFKVDVVQSLPPEDVVGIPCISLESNPGSGLNAQRTDDLDYFSWYSGYQKWADATFGDMAGEELEEAFWRTIILDVRTGVPPVETRRVIPTVDKIGYEKFDELMRKGPDATFTAAHHADAAWFAMQLVKCSNRQLCRTSNGRMALVPAQTQVDDEIWIFSGVRIPFVLRKDTSGWQLVGLCYVHGIMDGEAVDLLKSEKRMIELV